MTTSRSDVQRHRCMECGEECPPHERFCSDDCYDLWAYGPGTGLVLYAGYSTLPARGTESYLNPDEPQAASIKKRETRERQKEQMREAPNAA
jgi:hypothetical protein